MEAIIFATLFYSKLIMASRWCGQIFSIIHSLLLKILEQLKSELSEIEVKKVGSFDSHNVIEATPNHSQLKTQSRQHANAVENRKKGALNSSRRHPMWKIVLNVN